MLIHRVEKFRTDEKGAGDLKNALQRYFDNLVQSGFYCRKGHVFLENKTDHVFRVGGLLGFYESTEEPHAAFDSDIAKLHIDQKWYEIRETQDYEIVSTEDDFYCEHEQWKSLSMICNPILGTPSFVCDDCGGLVASYRIKMQSEIAELLWRWERQYDAIYNCWLLSGEYESWAEKELADVDSKINKLGLSIADTLTQATGVNIIYRLMKK
jgi:hypothetical protein